MKYLFGVLLLASMLFSCKQEAKVVPNKVQNWEKREVVKPVPDTLEMGTSYLSVYPQIYTKSEERRVNLTTTVSMRNPNVKATLYIDKIDYYNTKGDCIRKYISHPVFIRPMETVEIIIDHADNEGGTGANLIFQWYKETSASDPVFEAVMISTYGQMGLSFVTQDKRIK
ncbi:DUF3124 domain-containing protein [uncultured Draconibacterium sp.]|uniref:DUF3124 domain-containing protein n=1 Tax=uncultured Draconibacterium sp. TaxID=1573823 RepID=UPI0032616E4F